MSYMIVSHYETVFSHNGFTLGGSAPVHSDTLPENCAIADISIGGLSSEFEILGNSGNNSTGENLHTGTDTGTRKDGDITGNFTVVSYLYILIDIGKITYLYTVSYFCVRMDVKHITHSYSE